ncbi:MAG: hypothetical protein H6667_03905 [Ardenticatenaceae bacterium]|nr:hypothetical protein [Ardenticatenaceae bacterium]
MAKVKLNPILEQIQGQVGDLVFKRYGDEVVISRKPDTAGRELTEAQLAAQARFREAALYGKMVMADAETKALYAEAAKAKGKPVFSLTVADFFNAPTVNEVDLSGYSGAVGDVIVIQATDDFDVAAVAVVLTDADGNAIESGAAVETPVNSGRWIYTAQTAVTTGTTVRIGVTATDRPGGVGEANEMKII